MYEIARQKARLMYQNEVPDSAKSGDLYDALSWARDKLRDHEGSGHCIHLHISNGKYDREGFCCSFAKPEWSGDHCGEVYDEPEEAILMSVCEYLCGC